MSVLSKLGYALAVDFGIQLTAGTVSVALQTEKFYDFFGTSTFLVTTVLTLPAQQTARHMAILGMVAAWSLRLWGFLTYRIARDGHDKRFDRIRSKPAFMMFMWLVQGMWVFLTVLPVLLHNVVEADADADGKPAEVPLGLQDYAGAAVWAIGFLCEAIADHQKLMFRSNAQNADKFITSGLWSLSRHPNYFGEILCWVGLTIISTTTLPQQYKLLSLVSPAFITFLLTRVSGIPLLEKAADKKWGANKAYQAYKAKTHVLVPFL